MAKNSPKPFKAPYIYVMVFFLSVFTGLLTHKMLPIASVAEITSEMPVTLAGTISQDEYGNYLLLVDEPLGDYYYVKGIDMQGMYIGQSVTLTGHIGQIEEEFPYIQTTNILPTVTEEL